jgi:hypothetical protein
MKTLLTLLLILSFLGYQFPDDHLGLNDSDRQLGFIVICIAWVISIIYWAYIKFDNDGE